MWFGFGGISSALLLLLKESAGIKTGRKNKYQELVASSQFPENLLIGFR